mgnify:CR=1 FL=1
MKKMKVSQVICLVITTLCVIVSLFFCGKHLVYTTRGIETKGIYEEGRITYIANGVVHNEKSPYNGKKAINGEPIKLYYNTSKPEKIYLPNNIYIVFIFAGVGVLGIGATFYVTNQIEKAKQIKDEDEPIE